MRITLTAKQAQMLRPYFDQVQATAQTGYPGMLVAQLRYDSKSESYWMEPAWLDHGVALRITERGKEIKRCGQTIGPAKLSDQPAGDA
jgi:hypothetical protein